MAGNFTTLLWQKLFDELEGRLAIPCIRRVSVLMQTARNLMSDAGRALTGPLREATRKRSPPISRRSKAIRSEDVYSAFARVYARR